VTGKDIRKASLAELREMADRGDIRRVAAQPEDDLLPEAFWEEAELVAPQGKTSVHLKLEPEVFAFFKRGGRGHITRMQAVLTAYARAKSRKGG
jgi:uncharacterized protein (DUF4415 family)